MNLTLQDITQTVIKLLNIKEDDTNSISLVKNSINESYFLLCKIDRRVARSYIPIINGIATMPPNSLGIVKCTPELGVEDKVYGNSILTDKTGVLEVLYFYVREPLILDDDELDLSTTLQQAVINYACYIMCLSKNEINQAESFYRAYVRNVTQFEEMNQGIPETVVEVDY